MKRIGMARLLLTLTTGGLAASAQAHGVDHALILVCSCWNESGRTVACRGGFSLFKGFAPDKARFEVRDRAGTLLASTPADARGQGTFVRPDGDFYVLFIGPSGYVAEVDRRDVDATPAPPGPGARR